MGAIAVIGVIRLLLASSADMDFGVVRKFIPLRFDSLMIGVLLASFKLCYGGIYNKLAQKRVFLASLSGLTGVIILHGFFNLGAGLSSSFFLKTYGLTLLSVFTAGLIPYLEASKFINIKIGANKLLLTAITTLSIISYPIYLTHMEIFVLFTKFMSGRMPTVIVAVLAIGITIVFALLLNKLIEQPIMNFRDRLSASRKSKVSEPGASFARLKKVTALSTA